MVVKVLGAGEELGADMRAVFPVAEVFAVGLQGGGALEAAVPTAV